MTTTAALPHIVISGWHVVNVLDRCTACIHLGILVLVICKGGAPSKTLLFLSSVTLGEDIVIGGGAQRILDFGYQKLGACVSATPPLGRCCKAVIKLEHTNVQTVVSAALVGQTDVGPECPVGEDFYDPTLQITSMYHLRYDRKTELPHR